MAKNSGLRASGKIASGPAPRSVAQGGTPRKQGTNQVQGGGKQMGNRGQLGSTSSRGSAKGLKRGK